MLKRENFQIENIQQLQNVYKKDPALLERVIYAFGLLEALCQTDLPFIFKGGTSLMLLLDHPMRLSTDIDIIVPPGTDIDAYIHKASEIFPFRSCEEQLRVGKNNIVKRHFKFIYSSPLHGKDFHILLDVLFANSPYVELIQKEIHNELLQVTGPAITVSMPSLESILGDKLTAFAPHTTGVLLGVGKSLEIAKQLFDVSVLTDSLLKQDVVVRSYDKAVIEELAYRGLPLTRSDVLKDTIRACASIISRGTLDADDYKEYIKGIRSVESHILANDYSGEIAAEQACKVMYLAACVLTGAKFQKIAHPERYLDQNLGNSIYKKLSYMKKRKLEAYGYLVEAVRMLEN